LAGVPPKRVNSGSPREVTEYKVLNADDRDVEREHLNRILAKLASDKGADDSAAIAALRAFLIEQINDLQVQINNISEGEEPIITIIRDIGTDSTAVTTGATKVSFHMPCAMTLMYARGMVVTASSSGDVVLDINENGSSIFGTNKLTIDQDDTSSYVSATPPDYSNTALSDDALITVDVDSAGTGAVGAKVWLVGRYTTEALSLSYSITDPLEVGDAVSFAPIVSGGVYPFVEYEVTAGALPDGLTLDPTSGFITGTPTTEDTYSFTIAVTDSVGSVASYDDTVDVDPAGDPYFANVISLLPMTGTAGGTTFTDIIPGRTWTNVSSTATYVSSPQLFGQNVTDGVLALYGDTSSDWAFGTDDFTVEMWVWFKGTAGAAAPDLQGIMSNYVNPNQAAPNLGGYSTIAILRNTAVGGLSIYSGNGPGNIAGRSWSPLCGQWYHIAVTRQGTTGRVFVDGVQLGATFTMSGNLQVTLGPALGEFSRPSSFGYAANIYAGQYRATRGVARYTSNFTPPSGPFPQN
jgi:hypothetical protein